MVNPVLLAGQLLPLPLVWVGVVDLQTLAFAYALEAGVLALVHAVLLYRSRDRGWHWLVATATPSFSVGICLVLLAGDSLTVPVGAALWTTALLLLGTAIVAWRQDLVTAVGSPAAMTWRLGLVWGSFCAIYWIDATGGLAASYGSPVAGVEGAWGAVAIGLVRVADAVGQPVAALLAVLLVVWRAANEVLLEAWERASRTPSAEPRADAAA